MEKWENREREMEKRKNAGGGRQVRLKSWYAGKYMDCLIGHSVLQFMAG